MRFLFVYMIPLPNGGSVVGNVDATFPRERPTMGDVRMVERTIAERNGVPSVTVTGFYALSEK